MVTTSHPTGLEKTLLRPIVSDTTESFCPDIKPPHIQLAFPVWITVFEESTMQYKQLSGSFDEGIVWQVIILNISNVHGCQFM